MWEEENAVKPPVPGLKPVTGFLEM